MTTFEDRIYEGDNKDLYNEILNEALKHLKENATGLEILKGSNYKGALNQDDPKYDEYIKRCNEAEANMHAEKEGFAVDIVYVGRFIKEKGSPEGARCYLAMPDKDATDRTLARGEVYMSPIYIQSTLDAFGGDKNMASLYLSNVLSHEFTHGNQETKIVNEVSDCASALETDYNKNDPRRRDGKPKDGGSESWIITEANSDTAGFMVLQDVIKSKSLEEKTPIVEKYLEDAQKFSWIRSEKNIEFLKNALFTGEKVDAMEVFSLLIEERIKTQGKNYYMMPTFDKTQCKKWCEICYQTHLFGPDKKDDFISKTIDTFSQAMDDHKKHMGQIVSSEWLMETHPNPRVFDGTNAEFLWEMFKEEAKGKDKEKVPTFEEIVAKKNEYFKSFGISDEAFIQTKLFQQAKSKHDWEIINRQRGMEKDKTLVIKKTGRELTDKDVSTIKTKMLGGR